MGIAYVDKPIAALAAGALLLSLSLGGCATSTAGSSLMDAQAEAPAPPKPGAYPPLEDLPPKRDMPAMTTDERLKLIKELIAARERQAAAVKARGDAAQAEPMNSSKPRLLANDDPALADSAARPGLTSGHF